MDRTEVRERRGAGLGPNAVPLVLAVLVGLVIGIHITAPTGAWGDYSYLAVTVVAVVVSWVGIHRRPAVERRDWVWVALGVTLTSIGDVVFGMLGLHLAEADRGASVVDVFWLAAFAALIIGIIRLHPWGRGRADVDAVIDSVVAVIVTLVILWELALRDMLADPSTSLLTRSILTAYPLLDVVLLGLIIRMMITNPRRRSPALVLLSIGVGCWLFSDMATLVFPAESLDGVIDAGWMLALVVTALAIRQVDDDTRDSGEVEVPAVRGRMWLFTFPLLVPVAFELRSYLIGEVPNPVPLLASTVALIGLATIRGQGLLHDAEEARASLAIREQRFRALAANSADAVIVIDEHGAIREGVASLARLVGLDAETLLATPFVAADLLDRAAIASLLERTLASPRTVMDEEVLVTYANGDSRWLGARVVNLLDDPAVAGIVVNIQDVTERKLAEDQLIHQAFHDPLTGLANRALFADRIDQALRRAARADIDPAVLYLDVDGFKTVNDRFGHGSGDRLLQEIARRLTTVVRSSDTVARLGGDEFAILVEDNHRRTGEAQTTATRVLQSMGLPVDLDGQLIAVTASIGLAVGEADATAEVLLRNADIAMYTAKAAGKAQVVEYDVDMGTRAVEAVQLRTDLFQALELGQFEVFYQPVVALADEKVVGFEALLRWWHPELGMISPDRFIPLCEDTGLIMPIGQWVLDTACSAIARWQQLSAEHRSITMAVNVSARQLASDEIVDQVADALERSGLDASSLVLEMTETALVADPEAAAARLRSLRELGVRIAIDDFGTGYSSLSYLRQFPVDILKIDRSFVDTISGNDQMPPIVQGLLDLAHTLHLEIVAEGIELEVQRLRLRQQGCQLGQGYLFSRPLPVAEAERLLGHPDLRVVPDPEPRRGGDGQGPRRGGDGRGPRRSGLRSAG